MSRLAAFSVLLFIGIVSADFPWSELLQLPKHDGVTRVCKITEANYKDLTPSPTDLTVKVVIVENSTIVTSSCPFANAFPEIVAQLLEPDQVKVCVYRPPNGLLQGLIKSYGIHVLVNGAVYRYEGRKDVVDFITYLKKLRHSEVHVISGKLDKMAFDLVQRPRVVGYFINGSANYQAFAEASRIFIQADIPFYVVFDPIVSKHLKLSMIGQINLYRVYQKLPVTCSVNPASVADIAVFVNRHRGSGFFHLTPHNLEQAQHDLGLLDDSIPVVLAVGERSSAKGAYFHKLLSKIVRNCTVLESDDLKVVWIDPVDFPVLNLAENQLSKVYRLPRELPALGYLNLALNTSLWFNSASLNLTGIDKLADEQNMLVIRTWIQTISNNSVLPSATPTGTDKLIRAPKSQTVPSGSMFDLDCIVHSSMVGDCLWFRNGKHIGYNMDRFPQYAWAGDVNKGDCSLKVTGATEGRDDGLWHCELSMSVDDISQTVVSQSAVITIQNSLKTEL